MKQKRFFILTLIASLAVPFLLSQTVSAAVSGQWVNSGTITLEGDSYIDPNPADGTREFYKDGKTDETTCASFIRGFNGGNTQATLQRRMGSAGCTPLGTESVTLAEPAKASDPAGGGGAGATEEDSCESSGALGWLMCPIILALDGALNWVDEQIQALLEIDRTMYDNPELRTAWASIRNIAYIILVPIMLVMVVGTAIGSSMFDAYTVKKALPRMVVAVIFITLSFAICSFLITFFNVVGAGMLGLVTSPFGGGMDGLTLADLFDGGPLGIFTFVLKVPVAIVGLIVAALIFGSTFLVFAITAFGILLLRQLFIVALLLLAPLAILAWIFPGNDKLWKSWWGAFSKLLIMFPLIMVLIGAGRIFAFILNEDRGGALQGAALTPFLKLAAYMLPYAAIPFTFKFAGGLFATVTGMVNDKEKGIFDRLKKGRQAKRERFGSDQAINPNSALGKSKFGKYANTAASMTVSPYKGTAYASRNKNIPFLSATGRRIAAGLEEAGTEESKKLFQKLNEAGANDKTYRLLGGMHSKLSASTQAEMDRAGLLGHTLSSEKEILAAADILERSTSPTEQIAATALRSVAPKVAGIYKDPEMNHADVGAASLLGLAAHGFMDGEDLSDAGNAIVASGKGKEFAQSAMVQAQLAGARSRPDIKAGYGFAIGEDGKFVNGMKAGGRDFDLIATLSTQDVAMAKGGLLGSRKDNGLGDSFKEAIQLGGSREYFDLSAEDRTKLQSTEAGRKHLAMLQTQGRQWEQSGAAAKVLADASKVEKEQLKTRASRGDKQAQQFLRLAQAHSISGAAKDILIQNASRFSQASVDTKQKAAQLVHDLNLEGALNDYDRNALRAQGGDSGGEEIAGSSASTPDQG